MTALEDWLEDHRELHGTDAPPAPAGALYALYKADMDAADRRLVDGKAFGLAAAAMPGVRKGRPSAGVVYHGLTLATLRDQARVAVLTGNGPGQGLVGPIVTRLWNEHVARLHGGRGVQCQHGVPSEVWARAYAEAEASPDFDQLVEARIVPPEPGPSLIPPDQLAAFRALTALALTLPDDDGDQPVSDESDQSDEDW